MKTLLIPGHSGLIFGHYLTHGKRSPEVAPNVGSYEGRFNRAIANRLWALIPDSEIMIGPCNLPQKERRKNVNWLCTLEDNLRVIAIHANAAQNSGWQTRASGARVFVRKRPWKAARKADHEVSMEMARGIDSAFRNGPLPYPVRSIKKQNLSILKVKCPAVLVECGFQDNKIDAAYMASKNGRDEIAAMIAEGLGL